MSVFRYNGVTLPFPHVTSFDQSTVMDESNTDWMYTKLDITLQCSFSPGYLNYINATELNGTTVGNPLDIMKTIRAKLLKPRKSLVYTINNRSLIPGAPDGVTGTVDARNGPQPQSCRIIECGHDTFLCQYHIIAHYWEKNTVANGLVTKNNVGNFIIGHRWTETQSVDRFMLSTVTRSGVCTIRSDNVEGKIADMARDTLGTVAVRSGYIRENATYTVTKDGLQLQYTITERELYKMPPTPAYEADGYYTETTPKGGATRTISAYVRLKAGKTAQQDNLIGAAISTVVVKLHNRTNNALVSLGEAANSAGVAAFIQSREAKGVPHEKATTQLANVVASAVGKPPSLPLGASLKIGLYENTVEFQATSLITVPGYNRAFGFPAFYDADTVTPNSDGVLNQPLTLLRGSDSVLLHAAAYYDPSITNEIAAFGKEVGTAGKAGE